MPGWVVIRKTSEQIDGSLCGATKNVCTYVAVIKCTGKNLRDLPASGYISSKTLSLSVTGKNTGRQESNRRKKTRKPRRNAGFIKVLKLLRTLQNHRLARGRAPHQMELCGIRAFIHKDTVKYTVITQSLKKPRTCTPHRQGCLIGFAPTNEKIITTKQRSSR